MKDNSIIPLFFFIFYFCHMFFLESVAHMDMRKSQGHYFTGSDIRVESTMSWISWGSDIELGSIT